MKMHISSLYRYLTLSIISAVFHFCCTEDITKVADNSSLQIAGIIRNSDGTLAKSVSVHLFPAEFNPYNDAGTTSIDSTITNSDGFYSFSLPSSGLYNIYGRSQEGICFEQSIAAAENSQPDQRESILRKAGSVSGTVNLRQGDNFKEVIILVLGTNTYAMTNDSTGSFRIPDLAEGTYRIRILSTIKGYGFFDTTIVVKSGENTEIPGIITLTYGVPAIEELKAVYDKYFMRVTLSWSALDTSNIRSYYIFRNTSIAEGPLAVISNTCTTFTDNVLLPNPDFEKQGNILRYTVAACGRDGRLGHSMTASDILRSTVFTPEDTVSLKNSGCRNLDPSNRFTVDQNRNIFIFGNKWINKIDSSGRVIAEYIVQDTCSFIYPQFETDKYGNVYYMYNKKILKFLPDLTLSRNCNVTFENENYIKVDQDGKIMCFEQISLKVPGYETEYPKIKAVGVKITSFDSTLSFLDTTVITISSPSDLYRQFNVQDIHDGKITFFGAKDEFRWNFYTQDLLHGNEVQSFNIETLVKNVLPFPLLVLEKINSLTNGITIVTAIVDTPLHAKIFLVLDSTGTLIACCSGPYIFPEFMDSEFDGIDRFYCFNRYSQTIYVSKLQW